MLPATTSDIYMGSGDLNSGPLTYEGSILFFPLNYLQWWHYSPSREGKG